MEQIKDFLKIYGWAVLVVIVVIGSLVYFGFFKENVGKLDTECCDMVCGLLGPGAGTEYCYGTSLQCTYSYADRGAPGLDEVFHFKIAKPTEFCAYVSDALEQQAQEQQESLEQGEYMNVTSED